MQIIHILKNGSVLADISGHVVKAGDNMTVYSVMNQINKAEPKRGGQNEQKKK